MNPRHPLLGPALGLIVGITLGFQGIPAHPGSLAALVLVLSPPLAPVAFVSAGWNLASGVAHRSPDPAPGLEPVAGRVVSVPDRFGDRVRFRLRTSEGPLLDAFAPATPWPLALGDRIRMRALLRPPQRRRNPGGRDPSLRLAANGVALQAFAEGPAIREAPPSPLAILELARERLAAAADRALPPREAALVRAIGTGDRSGLDGETVSSFAQSGLAHVLAVSGLHLAVVAFGLERVLRALLLRVEPIAGRFDPRRISSAVALPIVVVYALATGAGVPILRAAIGAVVAFAGTLLGREARAANVLALAALALLAAEPGSALDVSLQLSFSAVAGLAAWAGPLRRSLPLPVAPRGSWARRLVEPILGGACATLAASAATAPVLAFHFRQIPLLGILANVAGVPVGAGLTVISAAAAVAAAVAPPLAEPLLAVAHPLAATLLALSDAAAAPRWGVLGLASPGLVGAAGAGVALLLATVAPGRRRYAALLAAAAFLLLPGPLRAAAARARGGLEVLFVSVGQGDSALLRLPDGSAVLVDAGGSPEGGVDPGARDVVPLLRDLGVRRLAAVFVSHPHPDHVLGLRAVADAFPIERAFSNGDPGDGDARELIARLAPEALSPGQAWERAGVRFEVAGGEREALAPNDASMVLRVSYGDTAFLFTGDVEAAGEAVAVARGGLGADVAKVPHHGSRTSSTRELTEAIRPRWAIVSLGERNRFGFPHEEAIARWHAVGAEVLRTDGGAVRFLSDGREVLRVPADAVLDPVAVLRERRTPDERTSGRTPGRPADPRERGGAGEAPAGPGIFAGHGR